MEKNQKKQPLQSRSKETVNSILEAATRILKRDGITNLNTNRIAEVAGVSVGSIYQFFKNKESILEELLTSTLDKNLEDLMKILDQGDGKSLRPFFDKLVDGIYLNFDKRGAITTALLEHAPQLIGVKRFRKIDERLIPILLEKMKSRGVKIRSRDPETAIFVILQSIRGVVSMSYTRPYSDDERRRVKRELVDLCTRYMED